MKQATRADHGRTQRPGEPTRPPLTNRRKVCYSLLTVLLALGVLEGVSRLLVDAASNAPWRWHKHVVQTLGFPGLNDLLVPDDELFWRVTPNLHNHALSGRIADSAALDFVVSTDARGQRCLPPVAAPRHRIVFLGDSTTFGIGVNDDQAFPALVQQQLPGVQCVNLGVPGYTAYQGRRLFERTQFGTPLDAVVIAFGFNDAAAWDQLGDADHSRRIAAQRARFSSHFRFVSLLGALLPAPDPRSNDESCRPRLTDREFTEELTAIIAFCRAHGAHPILMLWPHATQLANTTLFAKQAALQQVARTQHVRLVDLVSAFRAHRDPALFADIIHASPMGCELVAATLLPVLRQTLEPPPTSTAQPDPGSRR